MKDQYIIHHKHTCAIGVVEAIKPTPPKGRGWKLITMGLLADNYIFFCWFRRSKSKMPINEFERK